MRQALPMSLPRHLPDLAHGDGTCLRPCATNDPQASCPPEADERIPATTLGPYFAEYRRQGSYQTPSSDPVRFRIRTWEIGTPLCRSAGIFRSIVIAEYLKRFRSERLPFVGLRGLPG